jgi:hypothetical protein
MFLKIKIMKTKLNFRLLILLALFYFQSFCYSQEKEPLIRNWFIPERDAATDMRLIDLTKYYTAALDDDWLVSAGANLKRLPKGIQKLDSIPFDIRGIIQLGGLSLYKESDYPAEEQKIRYPEKVNGIEINQKASGICFLQASAWGEEEDKEVGQYIIYYEDNSTDTISLSYLVNLRDWWFADGDKMPENATQAWIGLNDITEKRGLHISLFNFKWENPHPDKTIKSIDFLSTMTNAAPYLVAITLVELYKDN